MVDTDGAYTFKDIQRIKPALSNSKRRKLVVMNNIPQRILSKIYINFINFIEKAESTPVIEQTSINRLVIPLQTEELTNYTNSLINPSSDDDDDEY